MERLTKRENGHTHYPRCFEEPCGGMGCRTEDCGFNVEICERLAAYEDTGLEPEEVLPKDNADEIALKLMRLADLRAFATIPACGSWPRPTRTVGWWCCRVRWAIRCGLQAQFGACIVKKSEHFSVAIRIIVAGWPTTA